jgi:aerobic-type carbon monoxide dehydrogenase small subunit (CoxS/CutS family)
MLVQIPAQCYFGRINPVKGYRPGFSAASGVWPDRFTANQRTRTGKTKMAKILISLHVNGRTHEVACEPNRLLLDCLRQDLGLTGSKRACDDSSCGACTVQLDGVPMLACTLLAASCQGQEITTVEGLAEHGSLAAIQKAYGDWGGAQCGYCTPGFMMTVHSLLTQNPNPSEEAIRSALSSNLCRCTGYTQMYEAVRAAIAAEQKGRAEARRA